MHDSAGIPIVENRAPAPGSRLGSLARIVRRDHETRTPTQAEQDAAFRDRFAGLADDDREPRMKVAANVPVVESFPAYSGLRGDALGYLWVAEFKLPEARYDGTLRTVFDPDGRALGFVETPDGFGVFEIGAQAAPQHQIRDSAGIRITENRRPAEGSRLGWEIGAEPVFTIGSVGGDEDFQLHRVDDAFRLGDGRLVVANGGSHELLVFDQAGNHLTTWGQKGEGPGDFGGEHGADAYGSRLFWTEPWPGDSIAVCHGTFSLGLELLSVFDLEGRHARTVNLAPDASNTCCREVLSDGSILASREPKRSGYPPTGMRRNDMDFFLLEGDGSLRAELGSHPGAEEFYYLDDTVFPPFSFWMFDPPFQQTVVWGAWGDLAIVSPTDRYDIRAYGADGSVARIVRRNHEVRAPTQVDLDRFRADHLASINSAEFKAMMTPVLDAMSVPPSFPAFSAIEVDALGYLWVREYNLPGEEGALWTVFDPDGIVRGFVETPPDLEIYEIGEDYIVGKVRDELRVEYVQLLELARTN